MNLNKIFTNKNKWLQNGRALNKDGSNFSFTRKWKEDVKEPICFSLHGAVTYFSEPESQSRSKIMSKLSKAIGLYTGKNFFVWSNKQVNTFSGQSFHYVLFFWLLTRWFLKILVF
jgi:hypothetical protein